MQLTAGTLAMINLEAQIEGLQRRVAAAGAGVADKTTLIELIALRGQVRSSIRDYEWAEAAAQELTQEAPTDAAALVARGRARGRFHRFPDALADFDAARHLGAERQAIDAERANVLQAVGRYDEAVAIYHELIEQRADFDSLGALATLHADRGEIAAAEELFEQSRARYRGVSPFAPALLDFQRGHMWMTHGDLQQAFKWFEAAADCLPAFAPALGHMAEIEAALGNANAALARLLPLATSCDDPAYAASLARILKRSGRQGESETFRREAAARYDELMSSHPEAFADHAAEFWLEEPSDRERARRFARKNLEVRHTARAQRLLARASLVVVDLTGSCASKGAR